MNKYSRISLKERAQISYLSSIEHLSFRQIAISLNRSKSTIWREMHRLSFSKNNYNVDLANGDAINKIGRNQPKIEQYQDFLNYLRNNFNKRSSSVDVCCALSKINHILTPSVKTVYSWIKKGYIPWIRPQDLLRWKNNNDHHKRISGVSRINTQYGTPIHLRKWDINDRVRIGDLEVDTVWGKVGTKQCLLTCVDRKSRKLFIRRILHKNAIDVQILLKDLLMNDIGLKIVKSVTQDRGTEFSLIWTLSSQLNIKVYVCHPYASCEKGSNENINGILRRFIPKGTDISTISDDQLKIIINEINNMPRKIHGFRSANQIWEEELAKKSN